MAKKEKTGESEPINDRTDRLSYRFWEISHDFLFILWVQTAALLICTFTMAAWLGTGYQLLFGLTSVLSTAWAIWASLPPKT